MTSWPGKLASMWVAAAILAAPAVGDIRTFNLAVEAGDYRAATIAGIETWPAFDRAAPDAAATAREFGWIAMLADQPATAMIYARFLIEQGASLAHPDRAPLVSRVLYDWANLAVVSSPKTRNQLYASLQQRARAPGRDLISVRAAHALYAEASAANDWPLASAVSLMAIRLIDEIGAGPTPARFELRRGLAVASFMQGKSPDAYNAIYDVAGELHELISTTPDGAIRERLANEYFAAIAWGDVMYGALGAKQKSTPDRRNTVGVGKKSIAELLFPAPGDPALPRCRVTLARNFKNPGFPFIPGFRDFSGEVIYALEIQPGGRFANPRLLVTAPHPGFAEATEDVLASWRWKLEGAAPPNCRMPDVHVVTFEFALGR